MHNQYNPLSSVRVYRSEGERPTIYVKALQIPEVWLHKHHKEFRPYGEVYDGSADARKAVEVSATEETLQALADTIARQNHFAILNCCLGVPGMKWPITEAIYGEFLEMLPPMPYSAKSKGFRMCEASHADEDGRTIRSAYYFENGNYWHEYVADEVKKHG